MMCAVKTRIGEQEIGFVAEQADGGGPAPT
jgi:hypothetical protein